MGGGLNVVIFRTYSLSNINTYRKVNVIKNDIYIKQLITTIQYSRQVQQHCLLEH